MNSTTTCTATKLTVAFHYNDGSPHNVVFVTDIVNDTFDLISDIGIAQIYPDGFTVGPAITNYETVCVTSDGLASTTPTIGDLSVGLAIIIVLMFLITIGFIWNTMTDKKKQPWR